MHSRFIGVSLALLCVYAASGASESLKLADLVDEALRNNREILAAQKRYEAARQRPSQASSLPDPMFSPGYTSNGNPLPGAQHLFLPASCLESAGQPVRVLPRDADWAGFTP